MTYTHVQQALEAAEKGGGLKCDTLPFSFRPGSASLMYPPREP